MHQSSYWLGDTPILTHYENAQLHKERPLEKEHDFGGGSRVAEAVTEREMGKEKSRDQR